MSSHQGAGVPNLRDSLRRAEELGATITWLRSTGEVRVSIAGLGSVKHNGRRKDSSRALLALIRAAEGRRPD